LLTLLGSNPSLFLRGQFMETAAFHDFLDSVASSPSSGDSSQQQQQHQQQQQQKQQQSLHRPEPQERQSPHSTTPAVPSATTMAAATNINRDRR